jgi:hypothetical protein
MILTLIIDPETLETTCDDSTVIINSIDNQTGMIVCEISKPDGEAVQTTPITWQQ